MSCVVYNCNEKQIAGRYEFFRFPADKALFEKWCKNIGKGIIPKSTERICEKHFTANCFKTINGIRKRKENAVPTIFYSPSMETRIKSRERLLSAAVKNNQRLTRSGASLNKQKPVVNKGKNIESTPDSQKNLKPQRKISPKEQGSKRKRLQELSMSTPTLEDAKVKLNFDEESFETVSVKKQNDSEIKSFLVQHDSSPTLEDAKVKLNFDEGRCVTSSVKEPSDSEIKGSVKSHDNSPTLKDAKVNLNFDEEKCNTSSVDSEIKGSMESDANGASLNKQELDVNKVKIIESTHNSQEKQKPQREISPLRQGCKRPLELSMSFDDAALKKWCMDVGKDIVIPKSSEITNAKHFKSDCFTKLSSEMIEKLKNYVPPMQTKIQIEGIKPSSTAVKNNQLQTESSPMLENAKLKLNFDKDKCETSIVKEPSEVKDPHNKLPGIATSAESKEKVENNSEDSLASEKLKDRSPRMEIPTFKDKNTLLKLRQMADEMVTAQENNKKLLEEFEKEESNTVQGLRKLTQIASQRVSKTRQNIDFLMSLMKQMTKSMDHRLS